MYKGTRWEDIRKNQRLDCIIYQPTQDTFDGKGDHCQSLQDNISGLSRENQDNGHPRIERKNVMSLR